MSQSTKALYQAVLEYAREHRAAIEAIDPKPPEDGPARWAWFKRQERRYLKRAGFITLQVTVSPRLWKKLEPWLKPYAYPGHPPRGSALVEFLEDLEINE